MRHKKSENKRRKIYQENTNKNAGVTLLISKIQNSKQKVSKGHRGNISY